LVDEIILEARIAADTKATMVKQQHNKGEE